MFSVFPYILPRMTPYEEEKLKWWYWKDKEYPSKEKK